MSGFTLDTPEQIDYFRLAVMKSAVKLESKGLKGRRSVTAMARRELGLKRNTPHSVVIAKLDEMLANRRA